MQFLYASLVPFHYRFASLLFIPVPRFSCCLDRVKNYATNFSIFFEIVPPSPGSGREGLTARKGGFSFHIYDLVNNHPLSPTHFPCDI